MKSNRHAKKFQLSQTVASTLREQIISGKLANGAFVRIDAIRVGNKEAARSLMYRHMMSLAEHCTSLQTAGSPGKKLAFTVKLYM